MTGPAVKAGIVAAADPFTTAENQAAGFQTALDSYIAHCEQDGCGFGDQDAGAVIDEVIAVGDEQFQRKCFDHLYSLRREGVTIVVVTHGPGIDFLLDGARDSKGREFSGTVGELAAAAADPPIPGTTSHHGWHPGRDASACSAWRCPSPL